MKTRQEQIEEMASLCAKHECLLDCINDCRKDRKGSKCIRSETCKILYKAGYRKASDVIDELVKNIMTEAEPFLSNMSRNLIRMCASKMKKELTAEMRQEV